LDVCRGDKQTEPKKTEAEADRKKMYNHYFIRRKFFLRTVSIISTTQSFILILAYVGAMAGYDNDVSFFTLVVHGENSHIVPVTVFALFTLAYMTFILLWSLSQARMIGKLVPNKMTSAVAFSQNARMMCRLAPPLVFSYFGLLFENGVVTGPWTLDANGLESGTGERSEAKRSEPQQTKTSSN